MHIESLEIENIKGFERLELGTGSDRPLSKGMNVFVGGNASGKTTLLKCIAMAVMGADDANFSIISTRGWVRQTKFAVQGKIDLKIAHEEADAFEMKLNEGSLKQTMGASLLFSGNRNSLQPTLTPELRGINSFFENAHVMRTELIDGSIQNDRFAMWNPDERGWFICAYGVARRLSGGTNGSSRLASRGGKVVSCSSLFDEGADLYGGHAWLLNLHAVKQEQELQKNEVSPLFDKIWDLLNDGLLPEGFSLQRVSHADKEIYVKAPNGAEISMNDLSDGCRSIYSLILNIIMHMIPAYHTADLFDKDSEGRVIVNKPGVVLIDELEAHLHPTWQQKICDWLKTRFPNVQFFVTTHSPLIAQAADEGGLFVLPMAHELAQGRKVHRLSSEEQERVTLGGAEGVLLSEAFSLDYTWSNETQQIVQEWERMEQRKNAGEQFTPIEVARYEELKRQLRITFAV